MDNLVKSEVNARLLLTKWTQIKREFIREDIFVFLARLRKYSNRAFTSKREIEVN